MTILYVSEFDFGAAATLVGIKKEPAIKYNPAASLLGPVNEITLVAQTNEDATTIGGKSPLELADEFATLIQEKGDFKHLYLIAPEAGILKNDADKTLAQKIAKTLLDKGFANLQVHAVSAPLGCTLGMRVEVAAEKDEWFLHAYTYSNLYSMQLDADLSDLIAKRDTLEAKVSLTAEEVAERTKLSEEVAEAKLRRRKDPNYKRTDVLYSKNIKELDLPHNTYTAEGPLGTISAAVALAISHLNGQKARIDRELTSVFNASKRSKQSKYIARDINALLLNPTASQNEVIEILKGKRDAEAIEKSTYIREIIKPLQNRIEKLPLQVETVFHSLPVTPEVAPQIAVSYDDTPGSPRSREKSVHFSFPEVTAAIAETDSDESESGQHSPLLDAYESEVNDKVAVAFPAEESSDLEGLKKALNVYMEKREQEPVFHGKAVGFALSLFQNSVKHKGRFFKIEAADKLISLIEGQNSELTADEIKSLADGRLGEIIRQFGGLDTVISQLPQPKEVVCAI